MSTRMAVAAALLGHHFHSVAVLMAGLLIAWALGALRLEIRGRFAATEERLRHEIRSNR